MSVYLPAEVFAAAAAAALADAEVGAVVTAQHTWTFSTMVAPDSRTMCDGHALCLTYSSNNRHGTLVWLSAGMVHM